MFTGIIEHQGLIKQNANSQLRIEAKEVLVEQLTPGSSIAVDGVCLTVKKITSPTAFTIDIMPETLRVTALGSYTPEKVVNLELPLAANGILGGHIVQGHIDGTATITAITRSGNNYHFEFTTNKHLLKYMVEKGSVAINGIALTLVNAGADGFSAGIIPHTWQNTSLKYADIADIVNIEVDVLAKYVYKFSAPLRGFK